MPAPDRAIPAPRIAQLDLVRGLAVMGILLANLPSFGLPGAAYFSPLAWGGRAPADVAAWFATFVLVEGKMRGLFSLLFGASTLLVMERAAARGASPLATHAARMAVLFAIGCAHLYLIWQGDILAHYALVGMIAALFARLPLHSLLALAIVSTALGVLLSASGFAVLLAAAPRDTSAAVATWNAFAADFGTPPPAKLAAEIDALRSGIGSAINYRWANAPSPLHALPLLGFDTLGAMLLGMAAYRAGFLSGEWPRRRYVRTAALALGLTLPIYAGLALATLRHGFDQRWVVFASLVAAPLLRPFATIGYAALAILAFRPGAAWSARVAAVGRMAFSNYLATSLLMLMLFTGGHRFATMERAELYWLAPPIWTAMLLWSPWWLVRFAHGPMEWLWRSAARRLTRR